MPLDLIITRKETAAAMELSDIAEACPAVLTETAAPETSGRYGFINTMQGHADPWRLWLSPLRKPRRDPVPQCFAPALCHACNQLCALIGTLNENNKDSRPEIILYNSHDGKSALKLFSGVFRFICFQRNRGREMASRAKCAIATQRPTALKLCSKIPPPICPA
jgi:hypothetical protein